MWTWLVICEVSFKTQRALLTLLQMKVLAPLFHSQHSQSRHKLSTGRWTVLILRRESVLHLLSGRSTATTFSDPGRCWDSCVYLPQNCRSSGRHAATMGAAPPCSDSWNTSSFRGEFPIASCLLQRALLRFVSEGGYKMQPTKAGPKPKILKEKGRRGLWKERQSCLYNRKESNQLSEFMHAQFSSV